MYKFRNEQFFLSKKYVLLNAAFLFNFKTDHLLKNFRDLFKKEIQHY